MGMRKSSSLVKTETGTDNIRQVGKLPKWYNVAATNYNSPQNCPQHIIVRIFVSMVHSVLFTLNRIIIVLLHSVHYTPFL